MGSPMEKRRWPRSRRLKAGTIEFDGGAIDCMIRNFSETGAALDVASPVGIPKYFNLVFRSEGVVMPCEFVWAQERRIGVRFC